MRYTPPPGATDPEAPYITGVPGVRRGSPVPAEAVENPQREIVNVISAAGITPDNADLTQLSQAVQLLINAASGVKFAQCASAASALTKEVAVPGLEPAPGAMLNIVFAEVNSAASPLLSVNGGMGRPILYQGQPPEVGALAKGQVYSLVFSGESWQIMAGMGRWDICQTYWFEDELERPGFVPLNGCTVENFSSRYPQAAAYLATSHGQTRCFASLEARTQAHVAIWHTLASGETVGWDGLGGLSKFFVDPAEDKLYLPDVSGMFRCMAGDGTVAPSMGAVMGDRVRNMVGGQYITWAANTFTLPASCDGPLLITAASSAYVPQIGASSASRHYISFDASRGTPTGATNIPRSWAALATCYLGQPAN